MTTHNEEASITNDEGLQATGCPVDHSAWSWQKTPQPTEVIAGPPIERDADGTWHVRSFEAMRAVLRSPHTKQAGFNAEMISRVSVSMKPPILYQEGKEHNIQRKQTARFFTPKAVSENYRQMMDALADKLVRRLKRRKQVDLTQLSLVMAIRVASEVIGLTSSYPGLTKRLESFFEHYSPNVSWRPSSLLSFAIAQTRTLAFFFLDVKPAIRAHRRKPRADVISHLLEHNSTDAEVLTECITYGAAGMVTTREFISIATWHFLERPELRRRYLAASEEERYEMLHETLRLEPVVGHLYRRATQDIEIEQAGARVTIPAGAKIDLHIYAANADKSIVGELPLALRADRELQGERLTPALMSFGDGAHRCPGSYIAIQESDIFLQRLLAIDTLRMVSTPSMRWNPLTVGYELRNFMIAVD
ncbi:MAG: cytochrome P450 [Ktedonobacteraceae bacterium]